MTNLPDFSGQVTLGNRNLLPRSPGIYFVLDKTKQVIYYIGKAKNLQERWAGKGHHRYKQFARKGLDKIYLCYLKTPESELDTLEKDYINQFKPLQNNTKVKKYLPKKSPKLSELQRLLKLTNTPLFPCATSKDVNGESVPREDWDMIRGFIAGIDDNLDVLKIMIVCQQNMGELLQKAVQHKTKKKFCFYDHETRFYLVNLRTVIFVFVELFIPEISEPVFEAVYPALTDCNNFGVTAKKLTNLTTLKEALRELTITNYRYEEAKKLYLSKMINNLKVLPNDFKLDEKKTW